METSTVGRKSTAFFSYCQIFLKKKLEKHVKPEYNWYAGRWHSQDIQLSAQAFFPDGPTTILATEKQGKTSRKAIDKLIMPKLSAALDEEQKNRKVKNFLVSLRTQEKISCYTGQR